MESLRQRTGRPEREQPGKLPPWAGCFKIGSPLTRWLGKSGGRFPNRAQRVAGACSAPRRRFAFAPRVGFVPPLCRSFPRSRGRARAPGEASALIVSPRSEDAPVDPRQISRRLFCFPSPSLRTFCARRGLVRSLPKAGSEAAACCSFPPPPQDLITAQFFPFEVGKSVFPGR